MEKTGLDNQEIADVMNYILNSWGNSLKTYGKHQSYLSIELIRTEILK